MKFAIAFWISLAAFTQAAKLDFKDLLQEVTAPADAKEVVTEFEFTNNSGKPVKIVKTDPGCSCLHVEIKGGKLTYQPGEAGLIRTTFDMGNFSGTVDKVVVIWLDDDPESKPSLRLTSRVHIPVLVTLEPKTLAWELGGKVEPKVIKIEMMEGETIHVDSVSSSNPAFETKLETVKDGHEYKLTVTPASVDKPAIAVIRISTDAKVARQKIQQAFGVVRKGVKTPVTTVP